ncbi:secretin N-terminal domain-containing protein [Pelagicoccus sp. SDUM812005]|uniref:type II secretion system protein GspD n=1 Tax=Pelagicoccus sp. SDUM812005 TaxID=3041257 RepID=UPI00280E55BF|nr:secretin N-terminal domain-containing protein [Pelagicoccus sp. SDUM812005]MDQ8183394.1 secretin N-terminal domain-containing protein [Pelagicoccus sp. SDUM812005]
MKSNIILSIAAASIVAGIPVLYGQEAPPAGTVRDGLREAATASQEQEASGPSITDLDRLFEDPAASQAEVAEDENGVSAIDDSFASPIGNDMALDASDLISVDYPNEEIRTVLRNVADLYTLNLVVPDTLVGTTSIKLRDVTWRQIYSVVLEPVGYTFIEEGSIIKVVSRDTLNIEPPVTEIFMVNYADADSIAATLRNLVDASKGGAVQVDQRSNALIVSERASKMDNIRSVVERLDKPTQQVFIETRFIEVTDTDVKNIGVNWSTLRNYGVGVGNINKQWGESFDRARSEGGESEQSNQRNLGDVAFTNGNAEMSGIGVNRGTLVNNLTGQTLVDSTSVGESTLITHAVNNLYSLVDTKGVSRSASAIFTADQFGFVLSALKEQGGSRLVSNPTVVTLNNQEATINVGEEFPIPNYQYNEETGGFEVSNFEYKQIGVNLKVTPSVNNAGLINLKVVPEVSSRTGVVNFGGSGGASIPLISTRKTETQIALKDGFTMGIGGLMESSNNSDDSHVPVLGKVPGLGRLFKHESKTETKRNLLIFITAKILPSEEADFEDVFSQEMMEASGVDAVSLKNR